MSAHPVLSSTLTAGLLALGMALPTAAWASGASTPVPCHETASGCPRTMSNDAWGFVHGNGHGADLGAGARTEVVGGAFTDATGIGGREREIDQFAGLVLLGTDLRTSEQKVYISTGPVWDRRSSAREDSFTLVLTHVEYLPPGAREVVDADVDNDGVRDLVVGDPGASCGSGGTGRLLIFFDISEVHDARFPEAIVCGLGGQGIGDQVNSNRKLGVAGNATTQHGNTWYQISGVSSMYSFVTDYTSWTVP